MEELDLKELLNLFWNKKLQIILIIAIFMVLGVIYTIGFVTPMYTSSTTLVLAGSDSNDTKQADSITATDITLNSKLVSTYSEIVKSKNVLRKVIENLNIDVKEETLRKNTTVTSVKDTELIEISVSDENPTYASEIADEIARVFTDKVKEIYNINNVYVLDQSETSTVPSNVNHTKDIVIFAFIGIIFSVMYVLIANMLDTTIQSQEDVERLFKVPVLAAIPFNLQEKGGKK